MYLEPNPNFNVRTVVKRTAQYVSPMLYLFGRFASALFILPANRIKRMPDYDE